MKIFEVLTKCSTLNVHNYIICDNMDTLRVIEDHDLSPFSSSTFL